MDRGRQVKGRGTQEDIGMHRLPVHILGLDRDMRRAETESRSGRDCWGEVLKGRKAQLWRLHFEFGARPAAMIWRFPLWETRQYYQHRSWSARCYLQTILR